MERKVNRIYFSFYMATGVSPVKNRQDSLDTQYFFLLFFQQSGEKFPRLLCKIDNTEFTNYRKTRERKEKEKSNLTGLKERSSPIHLFVLVRQSVRLSVSQSFSQSVSLSVSQSFSHSVSLSVSQSVSLSVSQLVIQGCNW